MFLCALVERRDQQRHSKASQANRLTGNEKAIDNSISSLSTSQQRTSKHAGAKFFNNKQPISVGV
jgi:hypothetical protein